MRYLALLLATAAAPTGPMPPARLNDGAALPLVTLGPAYNYAPSTSALKSDDAKAAQGIDPSLLLFVDRAQLASVDTRLVTQTQTPYKGVRVIAPTEPWETWSILAFHSVV